MIVIVIATVTASTVRAEMTGLATARAAWGETTPVLVASTDLEPGATVRAERRDVPVALVPVGAMTEVGDATMARQHVGVGEIITRSDIAPGHGAMALVPAGWLAVPVVEAPRSGAGTGDRVLVASDGIVLGAEALVVGWVDGVTLVALPEAQAPIVAAASDAAAVTLLRRP
jgi:hypothetical protein